MPTATRHKPANRPVTSSRQSGLLDGPEPATALQRTSTAVLEPSPVQTDRGELCGAWTEAELLRWVGFCPRCRRVVWIVSEPWRLAFGSEQGNALCLVPMFYIPPTDVLPRDREMVARFLGSAFTAFGQRYGLHHDCKTPEARPRPKHGWKPDRARNVYDLGE